ncbi:hypothetical protein D5086_020627 [Populus alba]|uniref:Uncharacterized protein n=1 Tax=Populus alba TaxID=43335 RepID=A0ACC4BM76_POPAL
MRPEKEIELTASFIDLSGNVDCVKGGGPYGSEVTRGQDLTGKDFSGRTLIKQDFKTSILRQANFKGAKLLGASFFDADLTGADLSDADLRSADLSLANVAKVNLSNANLEGALATGNTSFRGSNITGADFTDVPLREDQREYLCKVADGGLHLPCQSPLAKIRWGSVGKTICIDENQVALIKQLSNVMIPPSWLALFMPIQGFRNHTLDSRFIAFQMID